MISPFLSFVWNPSEGFEIGSFMVRYYSLMFVVAFGLGWYIMKYIFVRENEPLEKLDSLFIYTVIATLIGARLGHVIFYQPELFKDDPAFRELVQQHQNYEKRLSELAELTYPNEEEIIEETTLKKKKLLVKDEIFAMMNKKAASN